MISRRITLFMIVLASFSGCRLEENDGAALMIITEDFDFNRGEHGWLPGFADYPAAREDSSQFELRYAYTDPIDSKITKRSLMLSGKNVNKDLFMYIKRRMDNLKPDTDYTVTFTVELASDLNSSYHESGGNVYLKAGASHLEPETVIKAGCHIMNIDKGNAGSEGKDMILLGDLFGTSEANGYTLNTLNNTMANSRYIARTNSDGELWLIIGTDANCEGMTKVFYTRVKVILSAS